MFYMLTARVDCKRRMGFFFISVMADTYGRTQFLDVLLLMGSFSMSRSPHYSRFVVANSCQNEKLCSVGGLSLIQCYIQCVVRKK